MSKHTKRENVRSYVRFSLSDEESAILDKACSLDERTRCDFARIACMRFANEVVTRYGAGEVISMVKSAIQADVSVDAQK